MKLNVCARFLTLVAVALLVQVTALAQPSSENRSSSIKLRPPAFQPLHPCGLIREDPRTTPWMIQDTYSPMLPRRLSVSGDISKQMPPVGDQGQQGSCTAWAIGYYQKTHYEYREHHWNDSTSSHEFSPAFIYNQIDGGADQGSSFPTPFR